MERAETIETTSCLENNLSNKSNVINLVHQNIQGISGMDLEIELFLNIYQVDILCITEHWLKTEQLRFNFPNHQVVSSYNRTNLNRGGSLIILNNMIKGRERKDIVELSVEHVIEFACIESEQHIVLCVYRPPGSPYKDFKRVMKDVLTKISTSNKTITVCGDFNIDLLKDISMARQFINLMKSCNLYNAFLEPTRITPTTATCVDNIFLNTKPISKSILNTLKSDHTGQLVVLPSTDRIVPAGITFVPMNVSYLEDFKYSMSLKVPQLSIHENPNELCTLLLHIIDDEFNKIFESKTRLSGVPAGCEWATCDIYKSAQTLYKLYDKKCYNHDPKFLEYVEKCTKIFKSALSCAKSIYLKNKIKQSSNVIEMTLKVINSETGSTSGGEKDFNLKIGDKNVCADNEIENDFTNIPVLTTRLLTSSPTLAESLLKQYTVKCDTSFEFSDVSSKVIINTFKNLNIKKTADSWGLSVNSINSIFDIIAPHLASVFNSCVARGVFPELIKISSPLFKEGSMEEFNNFQPISILPTFSKVFEKIMLDQMLRHINKHGILHKNQFGFTKNCSTTDAGVELLKKIFAAWEESHDVLGIFCHLSKAFDCVHHETLIKKLHHYGIRNKALELLTSYLCNGNQRVDVNGVESGSVIKMGVPQGSILGPFLFLIYINDLPYYLGNNQDIVLFADDISLLFKVKRQMLSYDDVNNALSKVWYWFNLNNLDLNEKKTKCIKFTTSKVTQVETNVQMNDVGLDLVQSRAFLGITIDAKLCWGPYITRLSNRLKSAASVVKKIRMLTDIETARIVYFEYFHSPMSYGILLWGCSVDLNKIFVIQKRAVCAIYKLSTKTRSETLQEKFREINILTVVSQFIFENLIYVKKNFQKLKKNSDIHDLDTRNKDNLVIHTTRLQRVNRSFIVQCILFYNKLPKDIQDMSMNKFKKVIKSRLCKKGYYKISDYLEDNTEWL